VRILKGVFGNQKQRSIVILLILIYFHSQLILANEHEIQKSSLDEANQSSCKDCRTTRKGLDIIDAFSPVGPFVLILSALAPFDKSTIRVIPYDTLSGDESLSFSSDDFFHYDQIQFYNVIDVEGKTKGIGITFPDIRDSNLTKRSFFVPGFETIRDNYNYSVRSPRKGISGFFSQKFPLYELELNRPNGPELAPVKSEGRLRLVIDVNNSENPISIRSFEKL
jgi:hypothetical protein